MATRSGPYKTLRSAATYAANNTWYACTNTVAMGLGANCVRLYATVATASAGNVEFYVQHSPDAETTYFDYCGANDAPEIWGPLVFTGAATKSIELAGINLPPGEFVKVYFRASAGAASATIAIQALTFESASAAVDVSTGDIEISTEVMDDWDATHDSAIGADGCTQMLEAADIDGAAIPNAVNAEGDAVRAKATLSGVALTATVSEDGSYIQPTGDATARPIHVAVGDGTTTTVIETAGTKKALNVNVTDGTNDMPTMDDPARRGYAQITDGTTSATVDATTGGLDANLAGIAGTATNVNGGNRDAGTQTVTLADDDPAVVDLAAIEVLLTDVPNVIGTDGSAGPTKALSVAGTQATGELEEIRVDSDGHIQNDVLTLPGGLTGYAEDAAHQTGDIGIQSLAVRKDTAATLTDADGDYQPLEVDGSGRAWTHDPLAEALLTTIDADTSTIAGDTTSIDGKTPALGTAAMAASSPVTIATDDTILSATNALLTTMDADTSSMATDIGTIAGDTTSIDGKTPALGTAAMAASVPVTLATDDTLTTAIKNAVEIMDDWDDGADHCETVNPYKPTVTSATGSGAINTTTAISNNFELDHVSIHWASAIVAAESVTVSCDANDGTAYDFPIDITTVTGATNYIYYPPTKFLFESGDEIKVAMTGSDGIVYGLRIVTRVV